MPIDKAVGFKVQQKRLYLGLTLKLLTYGGLAALLWVFVNSLFLQEDERGRAVNSSAVAKPALVRLPLGTIAKDQLRKTRWNKKDIGVLHRRAPVQPLQKDAHSNTTQRSQNPHYFVFYNVGDSGNCPLFYRADTLKDICSGNFYDNRGRPMNNNSSGFQLKIPPHYFTEDSVFIGAWQPEQGAE